MRCWRGWCKEAAARAMRARGGVWPRALGGSLRSAQTLWRIISPGGLQKPTLDTETHIVKRSGARLVVCTG